MLRRWSLKEQNRGASLIAVLVALVFVGIMGMIIAQITITNIQLKEAERGSKANFYSAEGIMDDLTSGLNNEASVALQGAYNAALANYRDTMVEGINLQDEFTRLYLNALEDIFEDSTYTRSVKFIDGTTTESYVIGKYKKDILTKCFSCFDPDYSSKMSLSEAEVDALKAQMELYLDDEPEHPSYHMDFVNGIFTLKDVGIRYTDSLGYETHITTDVVFHTPEINFTGSNVIKDFMRYSLIADTQILVNAQNVQVDGNVYAGHEGILADTNGQASFIGNTVVTRGNVVAENGSDLTIGDGSTKLWVENIKTTGDGSASKLTLNGNFYVSDDLSMEGDTIDDSSSLVKVIGNYYGFNFQDKYLDVHKNTDAQYSSAIMINGKNSKLDMTDVNYLLLSGRTYISRGSYSGSGNQDIMLGESLSVRSNQLAYFVPDSFVNATTLMFGGEGITGYAKYMNMDGMTTEIESWLEPSKQVVAYHYPDEVKTTVYYLNFKDEQSANDFFTAYVTANRNAVEGYAENYVGDTGLIINDSVILTLKGDILYREEAVGGVQDKAIYQKHVEIAGGDWDKNGIYWSYANRLAMTYMSLQMYLEESRAEITADKVRFADNDKTVTPLMNNLMDVTSFKTNITDGDNLPLDATNSHIMDIGSGKKRVVILVDNNVGFGAYKIPVEFQEGIIIATGDVCVQGTFNGMIIAGGTITFNTNASVTSDEMLVSQMFAKDMAGLYTSNGTPLFAAYFRDYNTFSESVIGMIEIERFTTYEGWTKTEE